MSLASITEWMPSADDGRSRVREREMFGSSLWACECCRSLCLSRKLTFRLCLFFLFSFFLAPSFRNRLNSTQRTQRLSIPEDAFLLPLEERSSAAPASIKGRRQQIGHWDCCFEVKLCCLPAQTDHHLADTKDRRLKIQFAFLAQEIAKDQTEDRERRRPSLC